MKKVLLVLVLFAGVTVAVNAQDRSRAIGLRGGWGAELSYQHPLSSANRVELDMGLYFKNGAMFVGTYQWVWDLSQLAPGFKWYAGVGPALGLFSNQINVGAVGQIGIEYNFKIPLQLSLDYRPGYIFVPETWGMYEGVALGIRYKF